MKLILIMPSFMGYEKDLIKALSLKYEVCYLDSECMVDKARNIFEATKFQRAARKLIKSIDVIDRNKAVEKSCGNLVRENEILNQKFDIVFVINGHYISNTVYEYLKKNNPSARFILYLWDDAKNLFRRNHFKFFDEKYSYNLSDCKQYGMKYLPMFVRTQKVEHLKSKYDVAFIASAHTDRVSIARKLYDRYHDNLSLFIYLYQNPLQDDAFCYDKPLTYEQYINILRESKCVLDIPHVKQEGPTTRAFDVLQTNTKLITTNNSLEEYPVFSDNIEIIDRKNPILNSTFIQSPYQELGRKALTVVEWLKHIKI